ncbi:group II intron reverse transcriptase/maturase [Lentisphaerota bacterium WC36G]|nr:group II intron reverse transcriptase/maturase [Lentisphaerae bacterium WC36]UDQ98415.1 group II intron reverse transcriptase/maturase [Lentisphaerae bacterium WC36]UDQ99444.1 group II intron reverse transcriptase/maturase [Lentisphaerae bacterium WC36]
MSKTKENLKRQNLRNNEYYNFQETFDKLYEQSYNGKKFQNLLKFIIREENILLAYRNIKRNKGSQTQGVDSKDIRFLANMTTNELVSFIRKKLQNYFPKKVRRVEIPKANGKTRPLGIPTIEDRLIQQCIMQVLDPICEAKFYKHSYGFRPLRSAKHAIARCNFNINRTKLHYVVDVDIKGFFDNIDHAKLLKQLWALGIQDKSLLKVISKMLKAEIAGVGVPTKGTPQGGILSPLLANVALNEFDWWIASQWDQYKSHHQYTGSHKFRALKTTRLKEMHIVRYADDFKIFCRNYTDAKKIFTAVKNWLETRLKLEISPEKSRITNLKKNYSEFLGIKIKVKKKGKRVLKGQFEDKYVTDSHIADKAKKRILLQVKVFIKRIQRSTGIEVLINIDKYNAYVIGVHNYYNIATCCNLDFHKIAFLSLRARENRLTLRRRKHDEKLPRYIQDRYGKSKCLRFIYNKPFLPVSYVQFKMQPSYSGWSPYVENDRKNFHSNQKSVSSIFIQELLKRPTPRKSVEFNDNRIALFVAQYGKCAITGEKLDIDDIHCHHKKPIKHGGGDEYRNLIIIHEKVHKLIHASKTNTIQKIIRQLNLSAKMIEKLNSLRIQAQQVPIL